MHFCKVTRSSNNSNLLNPQTRRGSNYAAHDRKGPDGPCPCPHEEGPRLAVDEQARRKCVLFSGVLGKEVAMHLSSEG